MATNNANPTDPHHEPVNATEADTLPRTPPVSNPPNTGHWYSLPAQHAPPPYQQPQAVPSPVPVRDRRSRTARDRVRRRKVKREIGAPDDWAWVIIAAAMLGMTIVLSMSMFFLLQATRSSGGTVATSVPAQEPTSVLYGPGGILEDQGDGSVGGMLGNGQSMVINRWQGDEPFTILVMGMDQRPGEFGMSYRTDTMILIRLDPVEKRVGILSIPRDLYVEIPPNYGLQKINTAYGIGEMNEPNGGPHLAMQTVQYNLGIRVNEYVVVDFNTFITIIDLIGGINVEVAATINDPQYPDMNYGYDPFYLTAGWQHLDGKTALKYARTRHGSDDIDRGRRQQQVLYAIRDRVTTLDLIPQLAPQAYTLWSELREGINTGLSLEQILELAWWVKDIPSENYTNRVLGWEYVESINYNSQDILVPIRAKLAPLMIEVFGPNYNQ
ncbi:MAG: LCP family protein [Anaerolineae bacterium]|nr:LCP family protein [Anaerolineae bacterium]